MVIEEKKRRNSRFKANQTVQRKNTLGSPTTAGSAGIFYTSIASERRFKKDNKADTERFPDHVKKKRREPATKE